MGRVDTDQIRDLLEAANSIPETIAEIIARDDAVQKIIGVTPALIKELDAKRQKLGEYVIKFSDLMDDRANYLDGLAKAHRDDKWKFVAEELRNMAHEMRNVALEKMNP